MSTSENLKLSQLFGVTGKRLPLLIRMGDRKVICDTAEDLQMLKDALKLEAHPEREPNFSSERLLLIKGACQRYSLGKHQRLATQAIERLGR